MAKKVNKEVEEVKEKVEEVDSAIKIAKDVLKKANDGKEIPIEEIPIEKVIYFKKKEMNGKRKVIPGYNEYNLLSNRNSVSKELKKQILDSFKKDQEEKKESWKNKWKFIKNLIEVNNLDVDYDKMYLIAFYYDKKFKKLEDNKFFSYWHDDESDFFKMTFKEIDKLKVDGNVYTKIILISELLKSE